jgi:hypothetical protein
MSADIGKPPQIPVSLLHLSGKKHYNVSCSLMCKWNRRFSDRRDSLRDDMLEERQVYRLSEIVVP